MLETLEIVQAIDHLHKSFDDLILRGLRSAGSEDLNVLSMLREEFERIGAHHIADLIGAIVDGIRADDSKTAAYLFRAQASLRVFERILTLETVGGILQAMDHGCDPIVEAEESDDEESDADESEDFAEMDGEDDDDS